MNYSSCFCASALLLRCCVFRRIVVVVLLGWIYELTSIAYVNNNSPSTSHLFVFITTQSSPLLAYPLPMPLFVVSFLPT